MVVKEMEGNDEGKGGMGEMGVETERLLWGG